MEETTNQSVVEIMTPEDTVDETTPQPVEETAVEGTTSVAVEETTETAEKLVSQPEDQVSHEKISVRQRGSNNEYQLKLQQARQRCLEELFLDLAYLEEQYHEAIYMYDSRNGSGGRSFSLSVDQVYRIKNPLAGSQVRAMKRERQRDQRRLGDEIEIDGVKFSRAKFYSNRYFIKDLRRYYNNLDFRSSLIQRGQTWKLIISW